MAPDVFGLEAQARGDCRVVIHSIGNAGCGLVRALRRTLPLSEELLASLLFQAPSELITGIARKPAEEISALLCDAGLCSSVEPMEAPFEPGEARYEVAIVVRQLDRVTAVLQHVAELLGCDAETAKSILWRTPAVLVGKVSQATVEALRQRFEPLGVELDVSCPADALYDLFVGECSAESRRRLADAVRQAGGQVIGGAEPVPLLGTGLDESQAQAIWARFGRSGLSFHLLNRDFQRYDVHLLGGRESPALCEYLVKSTGMPAKLVPRVLASTPLVIGQNVSLTAAQETLAELGKLDAEGRADLVTFQTFALVIESARDRPQTLRWVQAVAGRTALRKLDDFPTRVEGPLSSLQARFLQHELQRIGAVSHLELR